MSDPARDAEERAFLDYALAHPSDVACRMAFADWWEERGDDLRAELWRTRATLLGYPPFDGLRILGNYDLRTVSRELDVGGDQYGEKGLPPYQMVGWSVKGGVLLDNLVANLKQYESEVELGSIGRIASTTVTRVRFGEYEASYCWYPNSMERLNLTPRRPVELVPVSLTLLPQMPDGEVTYAWLHGDPAEALHQREWELSCQVGAKR